ncbi:MAG: MBOAT family protein [Dongiaceae bacterium]
MLFNSAIFLGGFLPFVFAGYLLLARYGTRTFTMVWLTLASLVFYGWSNPAYVPLLVGSAVFNFTVGRALVANPRRVVLWLGIAANVGLLGYFKYTGFAVDAFNHMFGTHSIVPQIALPLAISFFTFQQIAYLIDSHDGAVVSNNLLEYSLFITFFPSLIAGPITRNREIVKQIKDPDRLKPRWDNTAVGATLFCAGLFKKVIVADRFAEWANPVFGEAAEGAPVHFIHAWGAALSYSMQLYFDFSGYSDMAIGLGLLFGIALPINFNSPYKARDIIDFWGRWHITLTRFLTAYIYNPLGVSIGRLRARRGFPLPKRGRMSAGAFAALIVVPSLFTMFISGLWHGAGWQFIVFGLLHGFYLVVSHAWRQWRAYRRLPPQSESLPGIAASVLLTFLCVLVAAVFFRASDVPAALNILSGMAGLNGVTIPPSLQGTLGFGSMFGWRFENLPHSDAAQAIWIVGALAAVWSLPNALEWLSRYHTAVNFAPPQNWLQERVPALVWRPTASAGVVLGVVFCFAVLVTLSAAPAQFIYFQF